MGNRHGQSGAAIRRYGRACIETKPAHPQHAGASHGQAQVERRKSLAAIAPARTQHIGIHQPGDTDVDVHHRAACKVQHTQTRQPAVGLPDPVGNGCVDDQRPQRHEDEHRRKAHALHKGADHQCCRDDGKSELKHGVHRFGNVRRDVADGDFPAVLDIVEPGKPEPVCTPNEVPQCTATRRESHRIAHREPQKADDGADSDHTGHDVEHAFTPHHTAIKQGNARQRHQQHQSGRGHHPGGVCAVDGGGVHQARLGQGRRRGYWCRGSYGWHSHYSWSSRNRGGNNGGRRGCRRSRLRRAGGGNYGDCRGLRLGGRLLAYQACPHAETQHHEPLDVHTKPALICFSQLLVSG